jgi:hypothetical protein
LRLKKWSTRDVKSMAKMKRMKPSQFSRPSIPATAPVKQEEMNLTLYIELLLKRTWGPNRRCCWSSGVREDMVVITITNAPNVRRA